MTSHASAELVAAFTPTGPLRASINLGNPSLANAGADGTPHGVSIDLAHAFAERLGAALELMVFKKQQLEADAKRDPGHRLLLDHFMVIQQAMEGRGEAARGFLAAFVEEMKASGFDSAALQRHGIEGASVAPAG
jgi:hypothetical protein